MLPGYVAGHYSFEECTSISAAGAHVAGARLIRDEAIGLDATGIRSVPRSPPIRWTCCRSTSARHPDHTTSPRR